MKKVIVVIVVFLAVGATTAYYLYNKAPESAAFMTADVSVEASTLLNDFDADENTANAKYLGKIVEVTGEVKEVVQKDNLFVVYMGEENALGGHISCTLDKDFEDMANGLTSGDQVVVKGKCTGFLLDVVLTDCSVKNAN